MCDWRKELSASRDLFPPSTASVSENDLLHSGSKDDVVMASWLDAVQGGASEKDGSSIDSLFALRDFMLQEALSVVKFA